MKNTIKAYTYVSCKAEWYSSDWLISEGIELRELTVVYNSSEEAEYLEFPVSFAVWYNVLVLSLESFNDNREGLNENNKIQFSIINIINTNYNIILTHL